MKQTFKNITKYKLRTAIIAITIVIMTFIITVGMYMTTGVMGGRGAQQFNSSQSQSESDTSASNSSSTAKIELAANESTTSNSDEGTSSDTDSTPSVPNDFDGNRKQGQSKIGVYSAIAAALLGAVVVIIITAKNGKLRRAPIAQDGTFDILELSKIKHSIFTETLIIVIISAVVGTGIGAALSSPVSDFVRTRQMTSMQSDNNFSDKSNNSDESFTRPERPFNGDSNGANQGDNTTQGSDSNGKQNSDAPTVNGKNQGNGKPKSSAVSYATSAITSLAVSLVIALIAGLLGMSAATPRIKSEDDINE